MDQAVVAAWDAVSAAYHARYAIPTGEIHLGPMVPSPRELGIGGRTITIRSTRGFLVYPHSNRVVGTHAKAEENGGTR